MKKNPNHPKIGSSIKVDPIRDLKNIKSIGRLLKDNPRNHLLFIFGINSGMRMGDVLKIRVRDIRYLKLGEALEIKEQKTSKQNFTIINKTVLKGLKNYLEQVQPNDEDFLFKSNKGGALSVSSVNNLIKLWCNQINLKGNFGSHTLRKTFGYIQRVHYGTGIEILMERFQHSSPGVTRRYIGVQKKEVAQVLMNDIG